MILYLLKIYIEKYWYEKNILSALLDRIVAKVLFHFYIVGIFEWKKIYKYIWRQRNCRHKKKTNGNDLFSFLYIQILHTS